MSITQRRLLLAMVATIAGFAMVASRHAARPHADTAPPPKVEEARSITQGERFQLHLASEEHREEPWPLSGALRVDGRLFIGTFGAPEPADASERGQPRRLLLHFDDIESASLSFGPDEHRSAPDLARLLTESWSVVTLDADGGIDRIAFSEGAPGSYVDVMGALLPRLFVAAPREGCAIRRERRSLGTATIRDCLVSTGLVTHEVLRLETELGPDVRVTSTGSRTRDERLTLRAVEQRESVVVEADGAVTASARLELTVSKASPDQLLETRAVHLGSLEEADPATRERRIERRLLERRAAPLSGAQLVETLDRFGAAGVVPGHDRFLWQAVARLRLEPSLGAELSRVFQRDEMSSPGRQLVFDLLAFAGDEAAQQTMRRLLGTRAAMEDRRAFSGLVQRFGFVREPSHETVRFLAEDHAHREPDSDEWIATAYALGAVLRRVGDPELRRIHLAELGSELDRSPSEDTRAHLLRALGNAGDPSITARVLAHAGGSSTEAVRAASAAALRYVPEAATTRALLRLLGDPSVRVAREAFSSLALHPLSDADWVTLDLAAQRLDPSLAAALITFLSERRNDPGISPRSRERLLARAHTLASGEPRLEARLRSLEMD